MKCRSYPQKISWFNQQRQWGNIDLSPKYQRNPVWSLNWKQYLIDSVMRNLPIPKIFVEVTTTEHGESCYAVIDGQQRMRAIFEFLDGEIEVSEQYEPEYGGLTFQNLPPDVKANFFDYEMTVEEIAQATDLEIKDMFKRLNRNTEKLNQQELRNAQYDGEFITLMSELADDEFWTDNKIMTDADKRRMRDVEFISELFINCLDGIQDGKGMLDQYYAFYDSHIPDKSKHQRHFRKVVSTIEKIMPNIRETRFKNRADFYSLWACISELIQEYAFPADASRINEELTELAGQIGDDEAPQDLMQYYLAAKQGSNKQKNRRLRANILRQRIIPHLTPLDPKRDFTQEEREIFWNRAEDHRCGLCGEPLEFEDYTLDHVIPHSKGGKTDLSNAQMTHKQCNSRKRDAVKP